MVKILKNELRQDMIMQRDALDADLRLDKSQCLLKNLVNNEAYIRANRVFCFVSMQSEIDTFAIINHALHNGKCVAVPKTFKNRLMHFVDIPNLECLKANSMGILEPEHASNAVVPTSTDLFLVPALAFDTKLNRLGYGGGYYDTYFSQHTGFNKIGIAFNMQVLQKPLPIEAHDSKMDNIVTENGWLI